MLSTLLVRRLAVLILFLSLFATTAAWASKPVRSGAGRAEAAQPEAGLDKAWHLFEVFWTKTGCNIDPDGLCVTRPVSGQADTGCNIDPNGRCHS